MTDSSRSRGVRWMLGNALKFIEEQAPPETRAENDSVILAVAVGFGRLVGRYSIDVGEVVDAFKTAHAEESAKWRRPIGPAVGS